MANNSTNEIDKYIAGFPPTTQKLLNKLRATIKKAAPKAAEIISYKMPAYKQNGVLIYFAGYKNHIGVYPTSSGTIAFAKELSVYKGSKGTIQLPLNKPLPVDLITKIVQFRMNEDSEKAKARVKAL